MSRLIRSHQTAGADVRALVLTARTEAATASPVEIDVDQARWEARVVELSEALAARDREISSLKEEIALSRRAGHAEGEASGRSKAQAESNAAAEVLSAGISTALAVQAEQIAAFERLALALAQASLEKVLGDQDRSADLVVSVVQAQTARLRNEGVLRVEVSATDFPSPDDLAKVSAAASAGPGGPEVIARADLPAGACRLRLRLGGMDVGLGTQWERLTRLFQDLARPEASQ